MPRRFVPAKKKYNLRLEMKESGSGKTAVRMLPFFCCQTAGTVLECFRISIFTELFWKWMAPAAFIHRLLLYTGCLPAIENRNSGPCLGIIIAQHFFQAADDFFL